MCQKTFSAVQEDYQNRRNRRGGDVYYSTMDIFKIIVAKSMEVDQMRNSFHILCFENDNLRCKIEAASKIIYPNAAANDQELEKLKRH